MKYVFDIDKIVTFLEKYKNDLPKLYNWNARIERLLDLETLTEKQITELNSFEVNI